MTENVCIMIVKLQAKGIEKITLVLFTEIENWGSPGLELFYLRAIECQILIIVLGSSFFSEIFRTWNLGVRLD